MGAHPRTLAIFYVTYSLYTVGIVRFTPSTAVEPSRQFSRRPSRPSGVSLTALAVAALALPGAAALTAQFHGQSSLGLFYGGLVLAIALYTVWSYWRGHHWARVLVLLASFAVVAEGISNLSEREGNLIGLMSHPLLFLRFTLAAFLLYWLNTRPVRAWFKNAPTAAELIAQRLADRLCTAVERTSAGWRFAFEHDAELTLNCPWRIVLDDNLVFVSNPTGVSSSASGSAASSASSNPAPDPPADEHQPSQLLENLRVKAVRIAPRTSDLWLSFEMGIELQSWSADPHAHPAPQPSSPQQWKFSDPTLTVIADAVGVNAKAIAVPIPGEDAADND